MIKLIKCFCYNLKKCYDIRTDRDNGVWNMSAIMTLDVDTGYIGTLYIFYNKS